MQYLVNSQEMKRCDRHTIDYFGMPSVVLMERAALAVFTELTKRFSKEAGRMLVVCGAGNNGGDGFAVARLLHLSGYDVCMHVPVEKGKMTQEAGAQYTIAQTYGVPEIYDLKDAAYAVIVDALFGIGLSRRIKGPLCALIECINHSDAYKIAVDLSSGILADTGQIGGTAVCADLTVTFGFAKIGQLLYPGASYTGELVVADIGVTEYGFDRKWPAGRLCEKEAARALLPKRSAHSNKGTYGKTLVIAGSSHMAGAAYLAAKAAYYSGCGLVRILTEEENKGLLLSRLPEAIVTTYRSDELDVSVVNACIEWADAILIGPGLSTAPAARTLVEAVLQHPSKKTALDADALNLLADGLLHRLHAPGEWIVTPHLKEMSRLTEKSITELQQDLPAAAQSFANAHHAVCVLKDARTVVGMPDQTFYVNATGNHGMATGGSGDVLSGFLAGLLAQGSSCEEAAVAGVYLHGLAGDLAAAKKGAYGMLASDLLEQLPNAIMEVLHT